MNHTIADQLLKDFRKWSGGFDPSEVDDAVVSFYENEHDMEFSIMLLAEASATTLKNLF